ncbi:MAG: glycosyltransferase [Leptolyngbyaceae cyanobacterium]
MAKPAVSVIIPIYNGVDDLPGLETCLLQQTFPTDQVEYLLVDNNSQDETLAELRRFADEAQQQGLRIVPLSECEIQSSYAARNRGIKAARGEILVFTDADCRPIPEWLAQMVQPFETANIGLVVGEIEALPGDSWLEQYAEQRDILSQKYTIAHTFYPYGQTANLAVRRVALQTSGLFRPYLTTGGDADLCWRIQMQGEWQLKFVTEAIVRHRHRSTLQALRSQWCRYGRSNQYLHELFGVPLQKTSPRFHVANRLTRWLLKGLPVMTIRTVLGQVPAIEIVGSPLDLFCGMSRQQGQRTAQLPEAARYIEWLEASHNLPTAETGRSGHG